MAWVFRNINLLKTVYNSDLYLNDITNKKNWKKKSRRRMFEKGYYVLNEVGNVPLHATRKVIIRSSNVVLGKNLTVCVGLCFYFWIFLQSVWSLEQRSTKVFDSTVTVAEESRLWLQKKSCAIGEREAQWYSLKAASWGINFVISHTSRGRRLYHHLYSCGRVICTLINQCFV